MADQFILGIVTDLGLSRKIIESTCRENSRGVRIRRDAVRNQRVSGIAPKAWWLGRDWGILSRQRHLLFPAWSEWL